MKNMDEIVKQQLRDHENERKLAREQAEKWFNNEIKQREVAIAYACEDGYSSHVKNCVSKLHHVNKVYELVTKIKKLKEDLTNMTAKFHTIRHENNKLRKENERIKECVEDADDFNYRLFYEQKDEVAKATATLTARNEGLAILLKRAEDKVIDLTARLQIADKDFKEVSTELSELRERFL